MKISQAIQVCYELNEENKARELSGLVEAMLKFKLKEGMILTYNQEEEIKIKGSKIIVKPVWKWPLDATFPLKLNHKHSTLTHHHLFIIIKAFYF